MRRRQYVTTARPRELRGCPLSALICPVFSREHAGGLRPSLSTRIGAPLDKIPVFISARYDPALLKPVEGNPNVLYRRALPPHVFYTDWSYIDHILVKPGAKTAPERHEGVEELYYVLRGAGQAHVNGESAPLRQDDALPVLFGDVHSFENTGAGDLQLLVVGVAAKKWELDVTLVK